MNRDMDVDATINTYVDLKYFIQKYEHGKMKDEFTEKIMFELKKHIKNIEKNLKNIKDKNKYYTSLSNFTTLVGEADELRNKIRTHKVKRK